MTECINPTLIKEGDLLTFIEGEAGHEVGEHVTRCPMCASRVKQIRKTSRALLVLMYRADCPAPEVLGQYQLGLTSSAEQLKVAAHVRACPHCGRELAELESGPDNLAQMVLQTLKGVARIIEATLVSSPRLQPAGVRGGRTRRSAFRGPGIDVLIGFQPVATGRKVGTLMGTVVQTKVSPDSRAWLFCEGKEPVSSPVDDLRTFTFEAVTPGEYDLALEAGERALLMREVLIDGP